MNYSYGKFTLANFVIYLRLGDPCGLVEEYSDSGWQEIPYSDFHDLSSFWYGDSDSVKVERVSEEEMTKVITMWELSK